MYILSVSRAEKAIATHSIPELKGARSGQFLFLMNTDDYWTFHVLLPQFKKIITYDQKPTQLDLTSKLAKLLENQGDYSRGCRTLESRPSGSPVYDNPSSNLYALFNLIC